MANELSSQNTFLMSGSPLALLCPIKDYPDSGSEPEQIEVTDLSDTKNRRYILGLQDPGTLTFTINYNKVNLAALKTAKAAGEQDYGVYFGPAAEYGGYTWSGTLDFWHVGKGVNEAKELTAAISVTDEITNLDYATTP